MESKQTVATYTKNGFVVRLPAGIKRRLFNYCKNSIAKETGGILIGKYMRNETYALVTQVCPPPPDSMRGKTTFKRGTKGVKALLDKAWEQGEYYIGEWHFHPSSSPKPSRTDVKQLIDFSHFSNLRCPEPIMIIVGGNSKMGYSLDVTVAANDMVHQLHQVGQNAEAADSR